MYICVCVCACAGEGVLCDVLLKDRREFFAQLKNIHTFATSVGNV